MENQSTATTATTRPIITSLKSLVINREITSFRMQPRFSKENGYAYVTFLHKGKAQNIYFGEKSARKIESVSFSNEEFVALMKDVKIILATSPTNGELLKLAITGTSEYVDAMDLFNDVPANMSQDEDYNKIVTLLRKNWSAAPDTTTAVAVDQSVAIAQ